MEDSEFLACLAADYGDLRDAAAAVEPATAVPSCPGWTVSDLVFHVATVYLHKVTVMRTGEWPRDWPPPGLAAEPPLAALGRTYGLLRAEFTARASSSPTPTWYDPDQTVAFWIRRMAQETVIHRIDAELAAGLPVTPVPAALAVDGIDEVLKRFLAFGSVGWAHEFALLKGERLAGQDGSDTITVVAGRTGWTGRTAWTVRPSSGAVQVEDGGSDDPRVRIEGAPDRVLRWLWGRGDRGGDARAGHDGISLTGDPAWADYLRRLLDAVTQ
jgi:uncharacterized protein (TIGR03083 family)